MTDFFANYTMTINGQAAPELGSIEVLNPANEAVYASAPACTPAQLDEAVDAARRAFPQWAGQSREYRRQRVKALGQAIMDHVEPLAQLLTHEQGKPMFESKIEVMSLGRLLQAQTKIDLPVQVIEENDTRSVESRRVPIGVVGAVVPWNFPLLLAGFKVGPALLTGNSVVLKPSPFTPLTALKIGELAREIIPAGVLNVISGGDELGPLLTAHPNIDKISFTGSTATGRRVLEGVASTLKRLTLELGGNDAAIVLPDVDITHTAAKLFWSAFGNNGQICIATKRLYIHRDIYEPLAEAMVTYARRIKIGDGCEDGVRLGPLSNRPQYGRILALIQDSHDNGHTFLTDSEIPDRLGYFAPITLLDNPPDNSRIVAEEQFGPILPLLKYDEIDEAVARANDCIYGLAGSVWSRDEQRAVEVAARMHTGTVFINHDQYLSPFAPFEGHKQSGFGVEGGVEGMMEYTQSQTFVRGKTAQPAAG